MKLIPFAEIVGKSKEFVDEKMAPIRERQMKSQAEMEMAKIDADVLNKSIDIQDLCLEKTINFEKLINAIDEIDLLERRKKQYQRVISELFPKKGTK